MKAKSKKPQSGAAGRKRRREKIAQTPHYMPKVIDMPYAQRLKTVSDWHVQVARIYRRMLSGQVPEYMGTKLVYVATAGAQLAKIQAELRHEEKMRVAFEAAVQAGLIDRNVLPAAIGGEYLPKDQGDEEDDDPMLRKHKRIGVSQ